MPSGSKIRSRMTSPNRLLRIALDDLAAPVQVGAVFPSIAGIEQKRRHDRCLRRSNNAWLAVFAGEPVVVLVEEIIAEAGGVQH